MQRPFVLMLVFFLPAQSGDQWNNRGPGPEENDAVTFAELGLAEDHFSHPEVSLCAGVLVCGWCTSAIDAHV